MVKSYSYTHTYTYTQTCPKSMWTICIGKEVISLEGPAQPSLIEGFKVAGGSRVHQLNPWLLHISEIILVVVQE